MRVRSGLRWTIHMDGLSQILAGTDGVQILKTSPALQKALFWYVLTRVVSALLAQLGTVVHHITVDR